MNLVGGPCPLRPPDTSTSYRVNVCAVFPGLGTTQPWLFLEGQPRFSPAPWLLLGVGGDLGWDGEGHTPPSLSLCLSVLKTGLDPRRCLVLGPGGGGGYQRTLGAPLASPQMSIFLRLCSVQGAPPCGVPEPALHTDTSSSIPWPARGSWHAPPSLGEGGILFLAIPCRPVLFSSSAPLGNREGGSGEGGPYRTGRIQPKEAARRAGGAGVTLHYDPQARGVSVLASQAPASPGAPAPRRRFVKIDAPLHPYPTRVPNTTGALEPVCDLASVSWGGVISPASQARTCRWAQGAVGDQLQKS
ncbi:uncharacterized protein LOC116647594 [Phoca vitulina]|uniref:uncharacterized protein LOC116647594 n=1 Tax=Phoca vitulina TaxID=9720 RepID=UPI0013960D21|nr:uncharacterized protein LOC116647594 [Phoca vitulina]